MLRKGSANPFRKVDFRMEECSSGCIVWGKLNNRNKSQPQLSKKLHNPFSKTLSALTPEWISAALQEAIDLGGSSTVEKLLKEVGLNASDATKYPSGFSGGQRQRIVLARALAMEPKFLVLDESVAALDLRIQADILALISKIQKERSLAFLFISHDLSVIEAICDRIAIMKDEIIEEGPTERIFKTENSIQKSFLIVDPVLNFST